MYTRTGPLPNGQAANWAILYITSCPKLILCIRIPRCVVDHASWIMLTWRGWIPANLNMTFYALDFGSIPPGLNVLHECADWHLAYLCFSGWKWEHIIKQPSLPWFYKWYGNKHVPFSFAWATFFRWPSSGVFGKFVVCLCCLFEHLLNVQSTMQPLCESWDTHLSKILKTEHSTF